MRTAATVSLVILAGALSGCGWINSKPGSSVEFVASNPDTVLLDFAARPPGELVFANQTATDQCQIFSHRTAVLESLNTRGQGGMIRATYLCKNGIATADTTVRSSTTIMRKE